MAWIPTQCHWRLSLLSPPMSPTSGEPQSLGPPTIWTLSGTTHQSCLGHEGMRIRGQGHLVLSHLPPPTRANAVALGLPQCLSIFSCREITWSQSWRIFNLCLSPAHGYYGHLSVFENNSPSPLLVLGEGLDTVFLPISWG